MKLDAVAAALLLVTAACARTPAPAASPAPSPAPATAGVEPQPSAAPAAAPADTAPAAPRGATPLSADDVRAAFAVFGDSADSPEGHGDSETTELTWDIEVSSYEAHERVVHFVNMFTGPARDRIAARIERGTRYDAMIRSKFRAGGVPEDMSYLALIESGYNPHAYSRAAAVGMWQFMASTGKGFGLRIDWWVDERRDPMKSTDAAIRFIRALNEQFGSLYLAAAAYNGGPGRIARGLTRFADEIGDATGEDRFFALAEEDYLPRETRDYVPQLIAAAIVAKDPARYGLTVRQLEPYAYDSVKVPATTPLAAVSRASGATLSDVRELNPHLLRGVTPPGITYWVRVPVGKAAGFDSAFAALDADERTAFKRVVAKKGDTMQRIAERHGVTARQVAWYNPNTKPLKSGRLRVGETILVPSPAVAAAAIDVPDPSIERYGSSSRGKTVTHVVKRGENLSTIARKYDTNVATLQRLNGLKKSVIFPGQTIVVRSGAAARPAPAARASRSTAKKSSRSTTAAKSGTAKSARSGAAKRAPKASSAGRGTAKKTTAAKSSRSATRTSGGSGR